MKEMRSRRQINKKKFRRTALRTVIKISGLRDTCNNPGYLCLRLVRCSSVVTGPGRKSGTRGDVASYTTPTQNTNPTLELKGEIS